MKYLVNRETKEHIICDGSERQGMMNAVVWKTVEADSEGWIPWSGGECPLPDDCECEITTRKGRTETSKASNFFWPVGDFPSDIICYRPILTELSEPAKDSVVFCSSNYTAQTFPSVFDRLKAASQAAASIPAIIAEIDAFLGPEYQVVRVEKIEATAPQEDMSDWRNWQAGDLVELKPNIMPGILFRHGVRYELSYTLPRGYGIRNENGVDTIDIEARVNDFRFHSRPSGVTK